MGFDALRALILFFFGFMGRDFDAASSGVNIDPDRKQRPKASAIYLIFVYLN